MSHSISLVAADGHQFSAHASGDPSAEAAVIILQEIFGVNAHIRSVADTYARHGFYVVAPALFDRIARDVELDYDPAGLERARALAARLSPDVVLQDIAAAIAHAGAATRGGRVGLVGYCLGGSYAWLSATRLSPAAVVGYYGSKIAAHLGEKPLVPVILHFGDQDRGIPLSDIDKIRAAHPEVPVFVYSAGHGFNRDGGASWSEPAANLAFARTLDFLRTRLSPASVQRREAVPQ